MRLASTRPHWAKTLVPALALATTLVACREQGGTPIGADAGPRTDAATDGGNTNPDGSTDPNPDGGTNPNPDAGEVVTGCNNPPIPATPNGTCTVTPGSSAILIRGDIITANGYLENGQLLIGGTGDFEGKVLCAACNCTNDPEAAGATEIACADGVVSPGLINAHDHITFTEAPPAPHGDERFDHRHDWRRGQNGHTEIPSTSNAGGDRGIWWGELRNMMGGATSINGSGGAPGLLRNLDQPAEMQEGLNRPRVRYSTFPLRDSGGQRLSSGCNYGSEPNLDSPEDTNISGASAYTPHIAEGIDDTARNEFVCLSQNTESPDEDVIFNKTGVIHGIGLIAADYANMAADRASLIWSPRSNIDLYGNTAQVALAANTGVRIAIGSDWAISGSMNMLREVQCAAEFNARNLGGFFSDRQLVDMATVHAAGALGAGDLLGSLAVGRYADVTIWNGATNQSYRAILDAKPADVVLVLRAGKALYGDQAVMSSLPETQAECETVDVCGADKLVCAQRETGSTIAQMRSAIAANAYDLFFCDTPPNEPSCIPFRPGEAGYGGVPMQGDQDGDGVSDALDSCPSIFNPVRPLDGMSQADGDDDGAGDACDPCPLQANATSCAPPNPNDRDADGVEDAMDNCPNDSNPLQENRDMDATGDVCDPCPDEATTGSAGCSATIYQVKQQTVTGRVRVRNGLATAIAGNGFFMQVVAGDMAWDTTLMERYSGVFVYTGSAGPKPALGDRVDVDGEAKDFFGQREVDASTAASGSFTVLSSNNPLPAPISVTPAEIATLPDGTDGPRALELEGVLVEVVNVTVTDVAPPRGAETGTGPTNEYVVDNALRVNDYMHLTSPFPGLGDTLVYLRGIVRFSWEAYRLEPRSELDVGAVEQISRIDPEEALVAAGTTGVPAGGLAVVMNRPVSSPAVVQLTSSLAGVTVPATVTVAVGQQRADIPLTISAMASGEATISATFNGRTVSTLLTIFDDTAPRSVASLTLTPTTISPSAQAMGTVTIDLPGRLGTGSTVQLAVSPPGLASLTSTTVVVAAGANSATFTLTTGTSTGAGTLTATIDGDSAVVAFTVAVATSRTPVPGDLVITEIFRNPSGTNEKDREWIEVHNPTSSDLLIDGLVFADLGRSFTLSAPMAQIPAGSYAVFAYWADPAQNGGVNGVLVEYGSADITLNNSSETITISFGGQTIDTISYTSTWPGGAQDVSACLKFPYAADNGDPAAWGNSATGFGTGAALGSPGAANDATNCP
ncbi:amidohydrolase family protein [Myxococcota bacterium]|nr:amidohydrolase family protein [Myxococcota bacterium]